MLRNDSQFDLSGIDDLIELQKSLIAEYFEKKKR